MAIWQGLKATKLGTNEPMCLNHAAVDAALALGADVETTACRRGQRGGPPIVCPFYEGDGQCHYQAQKAEAFAADVLFVAHEGLFKLPPGVCDGFGLVIIDESFWQKGLSGAREDDRPRLAIAGLNEELKDFPVREKEYRRNSKREGRKGKARGTEARGETQSVEARGNLQEEGAKARGEGAQIRKRGAQAQEKGSTEAEARAGGVGADDAGAARDNRATASRSYSDARRLCAARGAGSSRARPRALRAGTADGVVAHGRSRPEAGTLPRSSGLTRSSGSASWPRSSSGWRCGTRSTNCSTAPKPPPGGYGSRPSPPRRARSDGCTSRGRKRIDKRLMRLPIIYADATLPRELTRYYLPRLELALDLAIAEPHGRL